LHHLYHSVQPGDIEELNIVATLVTVASLASLASLIFDEIERLYSKFVVREMMQ
jgi:hypothetical protein